MDMKSDIKALFSTRDRNIRVPVYQRAYSWEKEHFEQFMDDLQSARGRYYLGHFLFEEFADGELHVIDGQQRLTTCVIFFSALYYELVSREGVDTNDTDDLKDYYLRDLRKNTQKFVTVTYDNNYFADLVLDRSHEGFVKPATLSQKRIQQAQKFFSEAFAKIPTAKLIAFKETLEKATITQFVVADKSAAAEIFAFQNDRGKKLSKLDILKSYFMLQVYLSDCDKGSIGEIIRYIESEFSLIYQRMMMIDLDEDSVLDYYWRSLSDKGYNSEESVSDIKKHVKENVSDKIAWIKDFIHNLASAFHVVYDTENSKDASVRYLLDLDNMALSYPFLIQAGIKNIDEPTKSRLAALLENITFRNMLRGGRAIIESRLNFYLTKRSKTSLEFNRLIDDIKYALKNDGYTWGYWNDDAMNEYMNSASFYRNRVDNYFLWRYELYLSDSEHPKPHLISFKELISNESIEHIAPQTPTDGSPVKNGYGAYEAEPKEEGILSGGWLHCAGNLMLISRKHNSEIGNKAFSKKLQSYGAANLLNQQKEIKTFIKDQGNPVWDKEAIAKRHEKMMKAAKTLWDIDRI